MKYFFVDMVKILQGGSQGREFLHIMMCFLLSLLSFQWMTLLLMEGMAFTPQLSLRNAKHQTMLPYGNSSLFHGATVLSTPGTFCTE
mmetsp:Transcript_43981/g.75968  ORF Transcript_43981/g.75968 Transcript_43981/m.75968 type:complete len:87 (+) Transcript_43981:122-382(+)